MPPGNSMSKPDNLVIGGRGDLSKVSLLSGTPPELAVRSSRSGAFGALKTVGSVMFLRLCNRRSSLKLRDGGAAIGDDTCRTVSDCSPKAFFLRKLSPLDSLHPDEPEGSMSPMEKECLGFELGSWSKDAEGSPPAGAVSLCDVSIRVAGRSSVSSMSSTDALGVIEVANTKVGGSKFMLFIVLTAVVLLKPDVCLFLGWWLCL